MNGSATMPIMPVDRRCLLAMFGSTLQDASLPPVPEDELVHVNLRLLRNLWDNEATWGLVE